MEVREPNARYLVKPAFKQTEVGVIPEDWEVCSLGEITDPKRPISYGIVQTGPSVQNGVPCLRVVDIDDGRVNKTDLISTSQTISNAYKRTILQSGDLVMPLRGKVGDVALIDAELAGCNLTRGVAVIALLRDYSAPYCKHFIASSATRTRLVQSMNGSALQEIPIAPLRAFEIALPPTLAEQQAIAEALSDADALIEALEQLLAKKRQIKQGTMQELLTGQKRLPGFSGEWEGMQLRALADLYQPTTISAKEFSESGYPVYGANGVVGFYGQKNHDTWQVTVTCRGSTCGTVNRTVDQCWITGNAMVLNCDQNSLLNKEFFYHLLCNQDLSDCITGTGQPQIVRSPLAAFVVSIPRTVEEQTAIATILSDLDAELAALETKLTKARQLKQGMMQELLTGRIRLV